MAGSSYLLHIQELNGDFIKVIQLSKTCCFSTRTKHTAMGGFLVHYPINFSRIMMEAFNFLKLTAVIKKLMDLHERKCCGFTVFVSSLLL